MYDQDASHMLDNVRKWKTIGGQQFDQYFQFGKVVCQTTKISATLKCSHFLCLSLLQKAIHQNMSAKNAQALQVRFSKHTVSMPLEPVEYGNTGWGVFNSWI